MKWSNKQTACLGATLAASLTVVVGVWVIYICDLDRIPPILEAIVTPLYAVLLWPGAMIAWSSFLGDNGTPRELQTWALVISLPINIGLGTLAGLRFAKLRRTSK